MRTRLYDPSDAEALDTFLVQNNAVGDVRLSHDYIFAVGNVGAPTGFLVGRPALLVHKLYTPGALGRLKAAALINFCVGSMLSYRHSIKTAAFTVRNDNQPMLDYAVRDVAAREIPGRLFVAELQ